ncbi:MAG: ABC transporter substrate-binding protein [Bacteroidaceae bacterium]|nr:ABC transporter substrate-binding protein [Bacteroidaceae bacterium]
MKSLKEVHNTLNAHVPWYRQHPHRVLAGVLAAIAILVGLCLMPSGSSHSGLTAEEQAQRDSAALHVALMPVHDCIPAYYAQRMGIYERLGLDLRILTLQAQLDTDTALMRGRAELIYSDLARAIFMQQDTTPLRAVAATEGELQLITARRGRVRQLSQLKERMVAVARHSITDYWSDRLTDTARMARDDIFRPQINDVRIRTDMLCNGTMDAAFLPAPYAQEALLRGNKSNFTTCSLQPRLTAFVASEAATKDSTRIRQMQLFFQGYNEAVTALNGGGVHDTLVVMYKQLILTPDSLIDSLLCTTPRYAPVTAPQRSDAETALRWLQTRGKVRQGYSPDSLLFPIKFE